MGTVGQPVFQFVQAVLGHVAQLPDAPAHYAPGFLAVRRGEQQRQGGADGGPGKE